VSFAAITLCAASQLVFIVVSLYLVIDSVRNLLVTPSCYGLFFPPVISSGLHSYFNKGNIFVGLFKTIKSLESFHSRSLGTP
jgi:hypothetical protein